MAAPTSEAGTSRRCASRSAVSGGTRGTRAPGHGFARERRVHALLRVTGCTSRHDDSGPGHPSSMRLPPRAPSLRRPCARVEILHDRPRTDRGSALAGRIARDPCRHLLRGHLHPGPLGGLTGLPWWHREAPDVERQLQWREECCRGSGRTGSTFLVPPAPRARAALHRRAAGWRLPARREGGPRAPARGARGRGLAARGGRRGHAGPRSAALGRRDRPARPGPRPQDRGGIRSAGEADLADALLGGAASTLLPVESVDSPFWGCYRLWVSRS